MNNVIKYVIQENINTKNNFKALCQTVPLSQLGITSNINTKMINIIIVADIFLIIKYRIALTVLIKNFNKIGIPIKSTQNMNL